MNKNIINRIVELTEPEKIILFGSQAQGTGNINSDIDMLVLIEGVVKNGKRHRCFIKSL